MGFADEVKQAFSKSEASATPPAVIAEGAKAAEGDKVVNAGAQGGMEIPATLDMLPTGTKPVDPDKPVVVVEPTKKAGEEAPPPAPIKILGKEFASLDLALKYAEELEIANREDKAFKEGFEKAQPTPPAQKAAKSLDEEVEEMIFENPKEAIKKLREGVKQEVFEAYNQMTSEQQKQARQEAERTSFWDNFYKEHSDLSESKEFVDYVLKKNWDSLSPLPMSESIPKIVELARKGLRISKEDALPKTELQSKAAVFAGVGGNATNSKAPATPQKPMDFISELASLRKRK